MAPPGGGCGECVQVRVHWYGQGVGCGENENIRVHQCAMSKQSGNEWLGQDGGCVECVRVQRYTMSKQSGNECTALLAATCASLGIVGDVIAQSLDLKAGHTGTLSTNGQALLDRRQTSPLRRSGCLLTGHTVTS